ncbi:T9SS type A sorting domain-containing protein [Coprobacter fastidiosus]|uniref:T9SS type A sorting domain-containing protein n=2 Tax=Coprobacter fastidiosus TaxID=1099853 RepID=UPI003AAB0AAF
MYNLPLQFELLNLSGTVLQQNMVRDGGMTIDLEVSVPGIYIYRIMGDKVYKSDKIVVR